jgi:hypothetical protein
MFGSSIKFPEVKTKIVLTLNGDNKKGTLNIGGEDIQIADYTDAKQIANVITNGNLTYIKRLDGINKNPIVSSLNTLKKNLELLQKECSGYERQSKTFNRMGDYTADIAKLEKITAAATDVTTAANAVTTAANAVTTTSTDVSNAVIAANKIVEKIKTAIGSPTDIASTAPTASAYANQSGKTANNNDNLIKTIGNGVITSPSDANNVTNIADVLVFVNIAINTEGLKVPGGARKKTRHNRNRNRNRKSTKHRRH